MTIATGTSETRFIVLHYQPYCGLALSAAVLLLGSKRRTSPDDGSDNVEKIRSMDFQWSLDEH